MGKHLYLFTIMLIMVVLPIGAHQFYKVDPGTAPHNVKGDIEIDLIGGDVAEKGEFPEVVLIRSNGSSCSATIVGPRVILTAAHCTRTGSRVTFTDDAGNHREGRCTRHPKYGREDVDVALCKLSEDYDGELKASIEGKAEEEEMVTLMGYGCTRKGGGGMDGKLRYGKAEVVGFTEYDFVTRRGSALCFGDSGGPAMKLVTKPRDEHHYIIGVNSKGDIRTTSYLTRTDMQIIKEWIEEWAEENDVEICGINKECDSSPPPGPNPEPDCKQLFNDFKDAMHAYERQCLRLRR